MEEDKRLMDEEFEEFASRILRLPRKGAFENMLALHLILSVSMDPLRKVKMICEAAFMIDDGKLEIDEQQIEVIYRVALSFLNSSVTGEGAVSVAWSFPLTEENYDRYVASWHKSNLPIITLNRIIDYVGGRESFLYQTYGYELHPVVFNSLKNEFLSWAMPIVMKVYSKLTRLVDPEIYWGTLQSLRGGGERSEGFLG
ncbi:MAG: hypothetical protein ABIM44_08995 [candidate division WOR-3 bacterium]